MIKKITVLLFAIMLVFMAGCDKNKPDQGTGNVFLGGDTGLTIKFLESAPPEETYDGGGNEFGIVVGLENKGEFEVPANKTRVTITGINYDDFGVNASDMEEMIGASITARKKDAQGNELPGGIATADFGSSFDYEGSLSGNQPFPIHASVCYFYTSKASTKICVNKDLLKPKAGAVCVVNEDKTVDNSGAPLHISTPMRESAAGSDEIRFMFEVKHVGAGEIFSPNTADMCSEKVSDLDVVKVTVDTGLNNAGDTLSCVPNMPSAGTPGVASGLVKLYSGARTVTCTQKLSAASLRDYEKELKITVDYYYKEHTEKSILVRHI